MGETQDLPVVADLDGTLVTEQKVLTQRAQAAVQALHRTGHSNRRGEGAA